MRNWKRGSEMEKSLEILQHLHELYSENPSEEYAKRKKHRECVDAVRQAADMFPVVYADTRHLNAVICLKKAGFEWVDRKKKLLRRLQK